MNVVVIQPVYPVRWFTSFFFLAILLSFAPALASPRLTEKQLEFLKGYVGKTYWVVAQDGKMPLFFSEPSSAAPSFHVTDKESFRITEIVISNQRPYYKTQFESGRQGYVSVDSFLEELNLTVLTQDPDMGQKRRVAKENEAEKGRASRIRAQRWPEPMKEAAIKRKAILGMSMKEARVALGKPARRVKIANNQLIGDQEQWIYANGIVLTFTNGVITRMQTLEAKEK